MNDYISRQWLMECVNEGWIKFDTEKDENRFIHLVRDIAPSAQPDQRWIPCSERMPKVDEEVLATTVWDDVTIACRIGVDEWFIHEGGTNATTEDLIAWIPLPDPYKEERKDDEQIRGFGL